MINTQTMNSIIRIMMIMILLLSLTMNIVKGKVIPKENKEITIMKRLYKRFNKLKVILNQNQKSQLMGQMKNRFHSDNKLYNNYLSNNSK